MLWERVWVMFARSRPIAFFVFNFRFKVVAHMIIMVVHAIRMLVPPIVVVSACCVFIEDANLGFSNIRI